MQLRELEATGTASGTADRAELVGAARSLDHHCGDVSHDLDDPAPTDASDRSPHREHGATTDGPTDDTCNHSSGHDDARPARDDAPGGLHHAIDLAADFHLDGRFDDRFDVDDDDDIGHDNRCDDDNDNNAADDDHDPRVQ